MTDTPRSDKDALTEELPLQHLEATPTRATHVTFFEDRAQVQRLATITLPEAGLFAVSLTGITRFVDDQSLTLDLDGEATLVLARIKREVISSSQTSQEGGGEGTQGAEPLDEDALARAIAQQKRELQFERQDHARQIERLRARIAHLHHIHEALLAQLRLVPESDACTPDTFRGSLDKITEQLNLTQEQEQEAYQQLAHIDERLTMLDARAVQSKQLTHEIVAKVEVQLRVEAPGTVTLTLGYTTGGALWRPSHRAQLLRHTEDPERGHIHFETRATIWQNTGERWQDIHCSFSTARPTQSAKPPILVDDVLYTRHKTHEERRSIQVTARDETISSVGKDRERQIDAMPGVDDGGEPLLYEAHSTISVASTGKAHHVTIDHLKLPCKLDVVAMPELSPSAHLRARTIWSHPTPLLAGPVTLLREQEHAGQAKLSFAAPGEPLDLGFGPISTLRVQRETKSKTLDKMLTRKNHQERKILLHVANMSVEPASLNIVERIPVSEIEQVEILLIDMEGCTSDEDGLLSIPLTLKPNQTRKLELKYEIAADPKVSLNF